MSKTKHVCPIGGYCEICEAGVGEGVTPPQPQKVMSCVHLRKDWNGQGQARPEPPTDTAIRLLRRYFANESESRGGYDELTSETADFLERLDGVSQGQAEPPSQPTDCPKHGGINQYCSVCLAELAEKVAIGARVSPTAAIDQLKGVVMKSGIDLIADERLRQVSQEGWTPEHDDEHDGSELADAAAAYALQASGEFSLASRHWPFDDGWKPSSDPIRNLVKAGALIAAEIDRLQRVSQGQAQTPKCRHCGLRIYIGPGLTPASDKLWRHHATNFTECHGGLSTHAEPQVEGQAEPPSQPTDCPKHGGINQYCSVCLAELAEKVAIGARVSPTAAIDALELAKQVLDGLDSYCGANDAGEPYEGEDCPHEYIGLDLMQKTRNALTAALKQGGTQS